LLDAVEIVWVVDLDEDLPQEVQEEEQADALKK
jgi:hypothetical protein